MSKFLSLPVEIHLLIFSEIPLNNIEDLTMVCKVIHRRSEMRLMEQYARKRHFSTIAVGRINNLTWDEDQEIRGVHPFSILRDLLTDPQSCLYTKTLLIGYIQSPDRRESGDFDDPEEGQLDEADDRGVMAQPELNERVWNKVLDIQQYLDPYPEHEDVKLRMTPKAKQWANKILWGDTEAAASLLISILPNIQKLRFVKIYQNFWNSYFLCKLEDLLGAAISGKHVPAGINSFSKLKEVGLIGLDEGRGANYEVLKSFMMLPSLRTIKGRFVDGKDYPYLDTRPNRSSRVTSLELHQSVIDATNLDKELRTIEGLQIFIYEYWAAAISDVWHWDLQKIMWEPRQIIAALNRHTRQTLKHLEITTTDPAGIDFNKGEPFIGSLRAFEVLETIRIEAMMLYKEVEGSDVLVERGRLVDTLPLSTRRLRLVGGLSKEDAAAMFEDLPALKDEMLPNLLSVFLEDVERSEMDEAVIRECEDAGVKMRFWRPLA